MATTSLQLKITRQWKSYPASKSSRVLWRQGSKRKESLQLRLWNLNPSFNSPVDHCRLSCQISAYSAKGKRARMKTNIEKCAKGNDVITNVITANQHFASSFSMQIFKFRRRSHKLYFFFPAPPPESRGDLARRLWKSTLTN